MPVTLHSDLKVYNPQTQAGYIERLTQNIDVLNASSQGTITMTSKRNKGHLTLEAFFKNTADLVSHRDINSTAAATPNKLTQGEMVDVKLNRKIGPLDATEDSLFKAGFDLDVAQFVVGEMSAMHVTQNHVHTALLALTTALGATPTNLLEMEESEGERIYFDRITGLENIVWRTQGEYAFNIGMKGFAWDVANGGINPTDTALGTAANWDSIMASHKDLPGVLIRHR